MLIAVQPPAGIDASKSRRGLTEESRMQAWEEEYVEYVTARLPTLRRLGYLLCGTEDGADDLVQQTITSLYVHWTRASAATHLDAYVRQMLVRAFLDEKRRPWSRVRLVDAPPESAAPE